MAKGPTLKVEGIEELQHALTELPQDIAKGLFQDALTAGAKIVRQAIEDRAPSKPGGTGNLKNSITVRWHSRTANWFTTAKGAGIQLDVGPEYSAQKKGYHAHLVEFGTKLHRIRAGQRKYGSKNRPTYKQTRAWVLAGGERYGAHAGWFGKEVQVSALPHPFLMPAFQASYQFAIERIKQTLSHGIDRAWSKLYKRAA